MATAQLDRRAAPARAEVASTDIKSAPASGEGVRPALSGRVLVVEDEAMIAWTLESLLEDFGFTDITLAADAAEALAAAEHDLPELLVTDINLGGGPDGVSLAARLAVQGVPVVFVSAYADEATRQRIAQEVPGADLLRKPIDGQALEAAVRKQLSRPAAH